MTEVVPHQPFDARLRKRTRVAEEVRGPLLQRVGQQILVAPALQMQNRADAQVEVFRVEEPLGILRSLADERRIRQ